jgi:hypothetical protein
VKNKKMFVIAPVLFLAATVFVACGGGNANNTRVATDTPGATTDVYAPVSATEITTHLSPPVEISVSNEVQLREAVLSAGDTRTEINLTADIALVSDFEGCVEFSNL